MRFARHHETTGAAPLSFEVGRRGFSEAKPRFRDWRDWTSWAVIAGILASTVSIAASGILLAAAVAIWLSAAVRDRRLHLRWPPFGWPVAGFAGAVALSICFSPDPAYSARYLTKAVKILLVALAWTFISRRQVETVFKALYVLLGLSAAYGVLQYAWLLDVTLLNRIRGFMSHWMTFSGQMMMGAVSLACFLTLARPPGSPRRRRDLLWWAVLAVIAAALLLTFTRNAWLGAVTGVVVLLLLVNRRLILPALAAIAVLSLLLPSAFQERLLDSFDLGDTTTQSRLELLRTGAAMVAERPLTGVGPRMVPVAAPRFRSNPDFPGWLYQHLHNTPLQIAAEMGLIGLAAWLVLWGALLRDFLRMAQAGRLRRGPTLFAAANALCVSAAFLASGLLEYNFGDSELLNLMVFFVIAPYVLTRPETTPA